MINEPHCLINTSFQNQTIGLAKNGSVMTSQIAGNLPTKTCQIKRVLFVPGLTTNLLSVNELINGIKGWTHISNNEGVFVLRDHELKIAKEQVILKGNRNPNSLFTVDLSNPLALISTKTNDSIFSLHHRMGHLSFRNLKKLPHSVLFTVKTFWCWWLTKTN